MRLKCIHSCMVLTVVGLLLVYSAFLTTPSYDSNNLESGDPTGTGGGPIVSSSLVGNSTVLKYNGSVVTGGPSGGDGVVKVIPPPQPPISPGPNSPATADTTYDQKDKRDISETISGGSGQVLSTVEGASGGKLIPASASSIESSSFPVKPPLKLPSPPPRPAPAGTVYTRDIYEPGFSYPNPGVCPNDGVDTRLLIVIASAPNHFSARDAIRLTWGHFAQRLDVNYAFIIGRTDQETVLDGIETEKHLYDDLIVANFEDSYDNLTLKTMATMEWIETYCKQSDYVLKTDDDMFINVPNLLAFIDRIDDDDREEPKLYGRLARKWKPVRNKKSKYYISFHQYKKTVYPDFTTGPAYLFSARLARRLFEKGMEKTYLKLEDVYTTGIVAQELKIRRMNIADFANKKVNIHKTNYCALSKLISLHMVAYHEQFELWKKMLDGRTKCKVIYAPSKGSVSNSNINSNNSPSVSAPNPSPNSNVSSSVNNIDSKNNNKNPSNNNEGQGSGGSIGETPVVKLSPTTNSAKKK